MTTKRHFGELLQHQFSQKKFVSVGLDTTLEKVRLLPRNSRRITAKEMLIGFNIDMVEATKDIVGVYKPNIAFYSGECGTEGITTLRQTIEYIHRSAPEVPVILDAKRGDIDNTNIGYVKEAFDFLNADAITLSPYMGGDSLKPFLELERKGLFLICRTSNNGSEEFQELPILQDDGATKPLYQVVAGNVATTWNELGNCGLVVGAPHPAQLEAVRSVVGDMPILIPGIGAQGGDLEASVKAGLTKDKKGIIVNSSRGIIYASKDSDYAEAARREALKLHQSINALL